MFTAVVLVVTHLVAAGAGAFAWAHVGSKVWASFSAGKAVRDAKKLVADAASAAAKLEAAKKLVASQPTGTTGVKAPSGPTGA